MATTTPDEIWTPDSGDDYALTTDLAAMADTIQEALNGARRIPHSRAINRTFTSPNQFVNQGSFANFPVPADAAAMALTFTKEFSDTRLILEMAATAQFESGVAQNMYLGLNINGNDYSVGFFRFPTAANRQNIAGHLEVIGIPAGELSIVPRFRTSTNSSDVRFYPADDFLSYVVTETY